MAYQKCQRYGSSIRSGEEKIRLGVFHSDCFFISSPVSRLAVLVTGVMSEYGTDGFSNIHTK